jgi:hypothetical protein
LVNSVLARPKLVRGAHDDTKVSAPEWTMLICRTDAAVT